jgi:hypothetical protein
MINDVATRAWNQRVGGLVGQCDRGGAAPARLLRDLHEILATGPARICSPIRPDISRSSLQLLLDAGAYESAALRLLGNCGYMLSRGGEGPFIASVVIPAVGRECSFSGASAEIALCGALALSLQEGLAAG